MTILASRPVTSVSLTAARLSIAAVIAYQVLLMALMFLRPELDPSWHTISEWAIGRHGWVMVLAFLISALSYGSLLVAIKSQVQGAWGKFGFALLLLCTIGTVGVGIFVTDPMPLTHEQGLSTTGALHVAFGTSAMLLLPFAALLINLSLALRNPGWVAARRPLLWTAGVPLAALVACVVHLVTVVMPMGVGAYGPGVPLGWPPRLLLLSYLVWLITLGTQVMTIGRRQA